MEKCKLVCKEVYSRIRNKMRSAVISYQSLLLWMKASLKRSRHVNVASSTLANLQRSKWESLGKLKEIFTSICAIDPCRLYSNVTGINYLKLRETLWAPRNYLNSCIWRSLSTGSRRDTFGNWIFNAAPLNFGKDRRIVNEKEPRPSIKIDLINLPKGRHVADVKSWSFFVSYVHWIRYRNNQD